jgi:hypothetical protein
MGQSFDFANYSYIENTPIATKDTVHPMNQLSTHIRNPSKRQSSNAGSTSSSGQSSSGSSSQSSSDTPNEQPMSSNTHSKKTRADFVTEAEYDLYVDHEVTEVNIDTLHQSTFPWITDHSQDRILHISDGENSQMFAFTLQNLVNSCFDLSEPLSAEEIEASTGFTMTKDEGAKIPGGMSFIGQGLDVGPTFKDVSI